MVITFAAGSIVRSIELFGNTVKVNDEFVDVDMTPKKCWPMSGRYIIMVTTNASDSHLPRTTFIAPCAQLGSHLEERERT